MPDLDFAQLREILASMETPLPWKFMPVELGTCLSDSEIEIISGAFITPFTLEFGDEFVGLHDVDAALIVGAVNALPALLDEIELVREALKGLVNAVPVEVLRMQAGNGFLDMERVDNAMDAARKALKGGEE